MKRHRIIKAAVSLFLALALTAAMPVMAGTEISTASPVAVKKSKTLNVLFIGNSFSEDTSRYLYDIVKQTGYKVCVGDAWIGGSRLCDHVNNASSNAKRYTYIENTSGSWGKKKYNGSYSWRLSWVMSRKKWDVIILQSLSTDVGRMASFYPGGDETKTCYLEQLARYCRKKCPKAHIAYNMTWALPADSTAAGFSEYGGQMEMCKAAWATTERLLVELTEEVEEVVGEVDLTGEEAVASLVETDSLIVRTTPARVPSVEFVIPTGTAVQNARSSYLGDTLHRDSKHLNYGIGRYIASMTTAACLGYPVEKVTSLKLSETASVLHLPVIKSSVLDAVRKPFSLSEQSQEKPLLSEMSVKVKTKNRKVAVKWDKVEGATSYRVQYKLPGKKSYATATVGASKSSYQFTGKKGTNHIRVYAVGDKYIPQTDKYETSVKLR